MDMQEKYRQQLDISYSYHLAKRMEKHRTNEELGYRTAGSKAELATGEMLAQEMHTIGFPIIHKDAITVDAWEFERAKMTFLNEKGEEETIQLGAYQTNFVTDGPECYSVVYAGRGTLQDYEGMDVTGKLVLVDINQRDEWWINYPVYQAHLKGAAAVIAAQTGGYGEVDERALNAQDIAGPSNAPAFSIARHDADQLKKMLQGRSEVKVLFDASTKVIPAQTTYNIIGEIPGKTHPERRIMLSAHYDSYFDGFQDDNTAISMMLSMGKTLLEIGYQPENTLMFCCMASEEWGYWWYTSVLSFNIGIEYACMSQGVQSFVRKKLISFFVGSILFLLVFIFIYLRFVSDGMKIASLIALNVTLPIVMVWVIQVLGIVNLTSLKFLGGISYELYLVHGIFIYLSKNYYSYGGTLIIVCYTLSIVTAFMLNRGSKYINNKIIKVI